jgi:diaminopimelate decarboxylase
MSSNYNARTLLPEVLVDGDQYTVIRRRQTYDDLIAHEK